uniref:SHSP domain-containing protein n=1 Tax=Astatotilapia calliptera TaxID=8154 RepID=A0AAX7VGU3_ASTCA
PIPTNCMSLGGSRSTRREPTQTRGEHANSTQKDPGLMVELNSGPFLLSPVGGAATVGQTSTGGVVRCLGDSYYMSADVSQFEPHDVVVLAYNQHVVIHAQKVLDDGSISDTFTHKSLFPEDMDPLSVSGTLNPDGTLVVSVRRKSALTGKEHLGIPVYNTGADL